MKRLLPFVLFGLSACGNYSNDDLDFQLALPQDGELEVKLPQALSVDDSAEYYVTTRKVVTEFNAMAKALVGLVDRVRGISPTSRKGSQRTWGPWPDDNHPGWQMRVTMDRVDDATAESGFNISYSFQVRSTTIASAEFVDLMTGYYAPSGNARRGQGQLQLWVEKVRAQGYPVADFGQLVELDLCYKTLTYPVVVNMFAQNQDTAKERVVTYNYKEEADGSGMLFFDITTDRTAGSTDLRFISHWLGSGAGRADAYAAARGILAGTDCWGPDSRATMFWRFGSDKNPNETSLCVFPESGNLEAPSCPQ
jgi:hypothetical protein